LFFTALQEPNGEHTLDDGRTKVNALEDGHAEGVDGFDGSDIGKFQFL